jgi:methyl-accepting chemotaxis protein
MALKPGDLISRKHPQNLFVLLFGIFMLFAVSSAVYLYLDIYRPLSTHYSAIVTIASDLHETLTIQTLKINVLFFGLITAGILMLGILYTHRVCGPLERVKIFAKAVSEGRMDSRICFREKDAIHTLGENLNNMTEVYGHTVVSLASEIKELRAAVKELEGLSREGADTKAVLKRASEIDARINEALDKITL